MTDVSSPLLQRVRDADIRTLVSRNAYERGHMLAATECVFDLTWTPWGSGGGSLTAKVREHQPHISYFVQVEVSEARGQVRLVGFCGCQMRRNCKHVAATLLSLRRQENQVALLEAGPHQGELKPVEPAIALSEPLASWVEKLSELHDGASEEYPPGVFQRLYYILTVLDVAGAPTLGVVLRSVRVLKDGRISASSERSYRPTHAFFDSPPKFLRPSDRSILSRLISLTRGYWLDGPQRLRGEEGVSLLQAIVATGRARLEELDGLPVSLGEPRHARVEWKVGAGGTQRPVAEVDGPTRAVAVGLVPPWYVDTETGQAGPLETGLAPTVADALLRAPAVPLLEVRALRNAIVNKLPGLEAFAPAELDAPERVAGPPVPRLELLYQPYSSWMHSVLPPALVARLSFAYAGAVISASERKRRIIATTRHNTIIDIERDFPSEEDARKLLQDRGFRTRRPYSGPIEDDKFEITGSGALAHWLDFLRTGVARLRAAGWEVEIARDFPLSVAELENEVEFDLRETSGIDWLELDMGVDVNGARVDLTPLVVTVIESLAEGEERLADDAVLYHDLGGGKNVAIPAGRINRMAEALRELYSTGAMAQGKLTVSLIDAAELARIEAETEAAGARWNGGERLRRLGAVLREANGIPHVATPATFRAELRPYQAAGVDWLQFLGSAGLGGILADDMGLGKTVQALAHLGIEKDAGRLANPALVVAPTSVISTWRTEAARFAPDLRVLVLHGPDRQQRFDEIAANDLVVSTYPLLLRDREVVAQQEWHTVILDEAQMIKNPASNVSKLVRELRTERRVCLTGTPIENNLTELWSLFAFLSPGLLGDRKSFGQRWRRPIETDGDDARRQALGRRVRPFLLRRTKGEVAGELPPKTEIVEQIDMEGPQRDLYEAVRLAMHDRVREAIASQGLARSHIILLDALLKMRQVCCDPRLLPAQGKRNPPASAKFQRLMEILPELLAEGRRILLFSQFTSMLALIEAALREAHIDYVILTGDTTDRVTPIRRFQDGEVPLFLISLKAGGFGLNLTAADTVIHYDPWWNPAVERQATDRAHRIGQEKPVFVYRLVTTDSIEEKIELLKAKKAQLADAILAEATGTALTITEADIAELFKP
ncbi:MAG: DEAD/DEAH box helicase [Dehalococcoidia bacterium]|nr:DEAD/DEAH box helicase [Dehalococcoidia bacterium]